MRGAIDPTFEMSLVILLKVMPRHLVKAAAAAKLPHQADVAYAQLAHEITERMRQSGWNVTAPPPPVPDVGL